MDPTIPTRLCDAIKSAFEVEMPSPKDVATAALALRYSFEIDAGGDVVKLGPLLLAALEALQMSPRSRAAVQKGLKDHGASGPKSRLDELAERRRSRAG